jgi:uroporphyrinogen-III decarboxylase
MNKIGRKELFKERVQRVRDAMALKEPDRVPITPDVDSFFTSIQAGISHKDAMYKGRKVGKVSVKVLSQYDWDLYPSMPFAGKGKLYDRLGNRTMKWAGAADPEYRLADNQPYQYIEKAWMEANEYEELISDMTGFLFRTIVPRQNALFQSFESFPYASTIGFSSGMGALMFFMDNKVKKTIKKLNKSVTAMLDLFLGMRIYAKQMKKLGNPIGDMGSTFGMAPFDMISDSLRGMRGTMIDMYKNPEELKKACDVFANHFIKSLDSGNSIYFGEDDEDSVSVSFIPLHRGADGFMSNEQFEEFYWPGITRVMEAMIQRDIIPMPFFEGRYGDRLEYLAEFAKKHKRKLVYWFHDTDLIKVKEMMGDYVTIRGNVPASLLIGGPPKAVEEYVKKCIEGCKDGGGYLVDGGVGGIPNESRHENVQAMTDAVHKYGVYRK